MACRLPSRIESAAQQLFTAHKVLLLMAAEAKFLLPPEGGFVLPGAAEADVGDEDSSGGDK